MSPACLPDSPAVASCDERDRPLDDPYRSGAVQAGWCFALTPHRSDNLRACVPMDWQLRKREIIGDMRGLQLNSYGLFVTVRHRHLPPPNRKRITAGSRSRYLHPARSCRARSMAGARISGAMQRGSPWRSRASPTAHGLRLGPLTPSLAPPPQKGSRHSDVGLLPGRTRETLPMLGVPEIMAHYP
jgi:hypothetical protein